MLQDEMKAGNSKKGGMRQVNRDHLRRQKHTRMNKNERRPGKHLVAMFTTSLPGVN